MIRSTMVITQCELREECMSYTSAQILCPKQFPTMIWNAFDMKFCNAHDVILPRSVYFQQAYSKQHKTVSDNSSARPPE